MKKKINIDSCYLVLISRLKEVNRNNGMIHYNSIKVKFTIIVSHGDYYSYDLFSGEIYRKGLYEYYEEGTMFINNNYYMIPLNTLIKTENSMVNEIDIIKALREPILSLNELLVFDDEKLILDKNNIKKAFNVEKEKIKLKSYKRRN